MDNSPSAPDSHPRLSQLSTYSNMSSSGSLPITPASSIKGHSRFPSGSTLASSPPVRASMDSYLSKRPLAQLREHPDEAEPDMAETSFHESSSKSFVARITAADDLTASVSGHFEDFSSFPLHSRTNSREEPAVDYDWAENLPFGASEASPISVAKRRKGDKADNNKNNPSILSNKIASRFPSISRKFKNRSEKRSSSLTDGLSLHESFRSRSRASSMRSVGTRESSLDVPDRRELSVFPTPRTSYIEEELVEVLDEAVEELPEEELTGGDFDDAEHIEWPEHPGQSRTPLLPPVLAVRSDPLEDVQSPLQSPKVAETPNTSPPSPFEAPTNPGLPSPPLSNRASIASFRHRCSIVPSSEIPPIALGNQDDGPADAWALRLGHENFSIQPEPYLPEEATLESCRRLKADWEQAEREFGRHLARTRANYSATSRIATLTEEKWAAINGLWISYHAQALEAATKAASELRNESAADSIDYELEFGEQSSLHEPVPMAQIPNHLVGGKFPNFGDAGIVGPMEVVKPTTKTLIGSKGRKRGFWRFLQDLIPNGIVSGKA